MKTGIILCAGGFGGNMAKYFEQHGLPEVAGWQLEVLSLDILLRAPDKANPHQFPSLSSMEHGSVDLKWVQKRLSAANAIILVGSTAGNAGRLLLPLLAAMARICQLPVYAFTVMPFNFEGKERHNRALQAATAMQLLSDHVEVLSNDDLLSSIAPHGPLLEGFRQINRDISTRCAALLSEKSCVSPSVETAVEEVEHA